MQDPKESSTRVGGAFTVDLSKLQLPPDGRARIGAHISKAILEEIARIDNLGDAVVIGRLGHDLYGYVRPDFEEARKIDVILESALKR